LAERGKPRQNPQPSRNQNTPGSDDPEDPEGGEY
jgi:hypothetical protein